MSEPFCRLSVAVGRRCASSGTEGVERLALRIDADMRVVLEYPPDLCDYTQDLRYTKDRPRAIYISAFGVPSGLTR